LVAEVMPDYMGRLHYISGPPKMVTSVKEQMIGLGVPAGQMKLDSFTGYD
jgi:ferredoxin-NADP reductase